MTAHAPADLNQPIAPSLLVRRAACEAPRPAPPPSPPAAAAGPDTPPLGETAASLTPVVASASDLRELLAAFDQRTALLHRTQEGLHAKVAELQEELREARTQVERSRRLAELGTMAAGISHEVRNPLGSIRLYARMLIDDLADRPGPRGYAERIAACVSSLDAIVGDVLTFARDVQVRADWCDARTIAEGAVLSCEGCCPGADRVQVRVSPSPKSAVASRQAPGPHGPDSAVLAAWCDARLIHAALTNIIRNAFEAVTEHHAAPPFPSPASGAIPDPRAELCEPGGVPDAEPGSADPSRSVPLSPAIHVEVKRRVVRAVGAPPRRMLSWSVRDTGPGIPPHVVERMFNPFFTTRAAGTGLGLAIVHRIADAHCGMVRVRNHRHGGAVVEMLVPDRAAEGADADPAS